MSDFHTSVMLKETLEYLEIKPGSWYVDCNLGGGGHTTEILKRGGKVIGIDLDPDAIREVGSVQSVVVSEKDGKLIGYSENLILVQGNFVNIDQIIKEVVRVVEVVQGEVKVAGILFDLGISSHQVEDPNRGFSFNKDALLDMRMDTSGQSATAADLINGLHEKELSELFAKLGEEPFAKLIAKKIVQARLIQPITTTMQLAQVVGSVKHKRHGDRTHPATQVFQALRIAVNDELNNLSEALPKALEILELRGKMVVISFHSLEDRIMKEFSKREEESGQGKVITKKPIEASEEEILQNPRSRSAKLRVVEKI